MAQEVPANLTALGRRSLPDEIVVRGRSYTRRRVFKNDFFAVTARYGGETGSVLLKVARQASYLGVPLGWLGRLLAAREQAALEALRDLDGVPRFIDRWEATGIIREYIDGHALAKGERVADNFHPRLRSLIDALHARGMAYVDLEKCANVLVGDDGWPYLFDFQISWYLPARWGGQLWPARIIRGWLQAGDRYHLIKLIRRTRPDQLSPEELEASYRKPWYVRVYTAFARPFIKARRLLLARLDPRRRRGERGCVSDEEMVGVGEYRVS